MDIKELRKEVVCQGADKDILPDSKVGICREISRLNEDGINLEDNERDGHSDKSNGKCSIRCGLFERVLRAMSQGGTANSGNGCYFIGF